MKNGRVIHSPLFLVRWIPVVGPAKFAAIASKKLAPTAVERNKMRRKVYEGIRSAEKFIDHADISGFHAAFFAKLPTRSAVRNEIDGSISSLVKKLVKAQ